MRVLATIELREDQGRYFCVIVEPPSSLKTVSLSSTDPSGALANAAHLLEVRKIK